MRRLILVMGAALALTACATLPAAPPGVGSATETAIELPAVAVSEMALASEFERARVGVVSAAAPAIADLRGLRTKANRVYVGVVAARAIYDATAGANNSPLIGELIARARAGTDESYSGLIDEIDQRLAPG